MENSVENSRKFFRLYQARWDARHLRTVSTHLPAREFRRLKRIAADRHVKVYAVLRQYLMRWMDECDPYREFYDPEDTGGQLPLGDCAGLERSQAWGPAEPSPFLCASVSGTAATAQGARSTLHDLPPD